MNVFDQTPERLSRARGIFGDVQNAAALLTATATVSAGRRVAASRLYAAAADEMLRDDMAALIDGNAAARAFYRRALAQSAIFALPEARAASSGQIAGRHGEGCHIRVEQSRAEPDQYFVVVEIAKDATVKPASLIVCDTDDRCRRFPLPAVRDGIAQIIADGDSDLLRLIGDPTTRVYLR